MICKLCQSEMELLHKFGDGHIEPREEVYVCYECGMKFIYDQSQGEWWESDNVKDEYKSDTCLNGDVK